MERAIRVITVERGFDPRDFALLAFGGAGPMHACELALDLGIRRVVLPRNPGLLCAWGALGASLGRELVLTVRVTNPELKLLERRARPLIARAKAELQADGARAGELRYDLFADVRYRGQSYELEVKLSPKFINDFHELHRRSFGHATPEAAVEVVNLRIRAYTRAATVVPTRRASATTPSAIADVLAQVGARVHKIPVYERDSIGAGTRLDGPLIVVELSSTAYVSPEFAMRCDDYGNLHLEAR
jgi:N-methylhydantoinase A